MWGRCRVQSAFKVSAAVYSSGIIRLVMRLDSCKCVLLHTAVSLPATSRRWFFKGERKRERGGCDQDTAVTHPPNGVFLKLFGQTQQPKWQYNCNILTKSCHNRVCKLWFPLIWYTFCWIITLKMLLVWHLNSNCITLHRSYLSLLQLFESLKVKWNVAAESNPHLNTTLLNIPGFKAYLSSLRHEETTSKVEMLSKEDLHCTVIS